jgi:L-arabinokinase
MAVLRLPSTIPASVPDLARFAADVAARVNAAGWPRDVDASQDDGPVFVARAPGRLDVMGGIADYSGALVLQWPIREATRVAVRPWRQRRFSITSLSGAGERTCDVPLDVVADATRPYEHTAAWFAADPARHWAAYVAGVFHVLAREHGVRFATGAAILIESDVPEGRGVSSSAAIEAATMEAVLAAWRVSIDPTLRAVRCQQVENLIVGAPCGVMDQMASIRGEAESLMALLCQPAEFQGTLGLPDGLHVWGIDSGIRHAITGADYGAVRVGAFMGYRILAELAGFRVASGRREGHVRVDDPRWGGYLANVGTETFRRFAPAIPESLSGAAFLARYHGTTDLVTRVDPSRTYAIRTPAAHPVHEHERVGEWARQLRAIPSTRPSGSLSAGTEADAARLGSLMYESHASYSACGLGSDGTDALVALARECGPARGIYGAKITGGGSGGTVAVLGRAEAGETVRALARQYAEESGRAASVFEGSSPGAARIGAIRLDAS